MSCPSQGPLHSVVIGGFFFSFKMKIALLSAKVIYVLTTPITLPILWTRKVSMGKTGTASQPLKHSYLDIFEKHLRSILKLIFTTVTDDLITKVICAYCQKLNSEIYKVESIRLSLSCSQKITVWSLSIQSLKYTLIFKNIDIPHILVNKLLYFKLIAQLQNISILVTYRFTSLISMAV